MDYPLDPKSSASAIGFTKEHESTSIKAFCSYALSPSLFNITGLASGD